MVRASSRVDALGAGFGVFYAMVGLFEVTSDALVTLVAASRRVAGHTPRLFARGRATPPPNLVTPWPLFRLSSVSWKLGLWERAAGDAG